MELPAQRSPVRHRAGILEFVTGLRGIRVMIAAVAVSIAVAGCGDGSGGLPDAEFLLRGARAASGDVTSVHVQMSASGPIPGLAVRGLTADIRGRDDSKPGASVGTAEVAGSAVAFVEQDGKLYTKSANGSYAPAPESAGRGFPIPSTLIDPDRGLARMLANMRDARTEVRETVDGVQAFRVTGDIPREDAAVWIPSVTTDTRLTVWFATAGRHLPVKTELAVPDSSGKVTTIGFALSNPNKKVQVPTVA